MKPEKHICCDQIYSRESGWSSRHTCGKTASIEEDGKWYCRTHAPSFRKAKLDAKMAEWNAAWERKRKEVAIEAWKTRVGAAVFKLADDPAVTDEIRGFLAEVIQEQKEPKP